MTASRNGKRLISLVASGIALTMLVLATLTGCGPDRSGVAAPNKPPRVYIVNTPPDSAQFSRNPDLNWYATDIDGFIALFRYAVVLDSNLQINGQRVPVDVFVDQATDEQFNWTSLKVDLDHPQSTATVRLYANVDFPVDSFVIQYFFIQAQDDGGAKSDIAWRRYSRNNHYPNTHQRSDAVYINAKDTNSMAPGIRLVWDGADSTDWGRARPPLEFEWRLFGPFNKNDSVYVNIVKENCIWNPDSGKFTNCASARVLDLGAIPQVVNGVQQPLARSKGPKYAFDTTDVWVTDEATTVYDVFRDVPNLTKTTQFKFVFWVRARDDGFVPDPTPAFSQFYVVEALFEKAVAIQDETSFKRSAYWTPLSLDLVKQLYADYINVALQEIYGAGYRPFDTFSITDPKYPPGTETDYFSIHRGKGQTVPVLPTLVDLLSHKVQLFINDDADGSPDVSYAGLLGGVHFAMDMGASGWLMARNVAPDVGLNQNSEPGLYPLSAEFARHWGMEAIYHEGWTFLSLGRVIDTFKSTQAIWNEQFAGCYSLLPDLVPDMDINLNYLMTRYLTLSDSTFLPLHLPLDTHYLKGLPEVGAGTRTLVAAPVYLYKSKDGENSSLNGQVMGVVQDYGGIRSIGFLFTPLSTREDQTRVLFVNCLSWLMQKFEPQPSVTPKELAGSSGFSTNIDLSGRRARIRQYLREINDQGFTDPQVFESLGLTVAPPIVSPGGSAE